MPELAGDFETFSNIARIGIGMGPRRRLDRAQSHAKVAATPPVIPIQPRRSWSAPSDMSCSSMIRRYTETQVATIIKRSKRLLREGFAQDLVLSGLKRIISDLGEAEESNEDHLRPLADFIRTLERKGTSSESRPQL
jgi:hypothetical protein